jgi:hypothetical protein
MPAGADARAERWVRLPAGWVDPDGVRHEWAAMRPARAADELRALRDFRVWLRPASFLPVLLARVVTRLAPDGANRAAAREQVGVAVIEKLAPADLEALERAYRDLNGYAAACAGAEEARA